MQEVDAGAVVALSCQSPVAGKAAGWTGVAGEVGQVAILPERALEDAFVCAEVIGYSVPALATLTN